MAGPKILYREWRTKPPAYGARLRRDKWGEGIVACFPWWDGKNGGDILTLTRVDDTHNQMIQDWGRYGRQLHGQDGNNSRAVISSPNADRWFARYSAFSLLNIFKGDDGAHSAEGIVFADNCFDSMWSSGTNFRNRIYNDSGASQESGHSLTADTAWHTTVATWASGEVVRGFIDDLAPDDSAATLAGPLMGATGNPLRFGRTAAGGPSASFDGVMSLFVMWGDRQFPDPVAYELIDNPWRIWEPRRLYLAAAAATDDMVVTDDEVAFAEGGVDLTGVGTLAVAGSNVAFGEGTVDLNAVGSLDVADDPVAFAEGPVDLNAIGSLDVADDNVAFADGAIDLKAIGTLAVADDPVLFAEGAIDLDDANFTQDLDVTDDNVAFAEPTIDLNAVGSLDVTDDEAAFAEGDIGLTAIGTLAVGDDPVAFAEAVIDLLAASAGDMVVTDDPVAFAEGSIGLTSVGLLRVTDDTVAYGEAVINLTDANALVIAVGAEGDPWGAWENYRYYRRRYLARKEREAPFSEVVTAETTTEPLALEAAVLAEDIVEFEELRTGIDSELKVAEIEAKVVKLEEAIDFEAQKQRLDELRRVASELAKAVELARELRRRISEEIAIVMAVMLLFFGDK